MPNHRISDSVRQDLLATVEVLMRRRVSHMETGLPISFQQLQDGLLPKKWREVVPEMNKAGVGMQQHNRVTVWLRHDLIVRDACAVMTAKKQLLGVNWHRPMDFFLDVLSQDETVALARWVNTAVSERRLARLVKRVTTEFFTHHAPTTAHVHARWPEMRIVFDHVAKVTGTWGRRASRDAWRERIDDQVRNPRKYVWDTDDELTWEEKSRRARELIGGVLAGALLLPTEIEDKSDIHAEVDRWKALPTDPDK